MADVGRQPGGSLNGLLVVDKPSGPSSHDVVVRVRRAIREPRIGHTGTLDPMATGVLPLVVGQATRLARFLAGAPKTYTAEIRLGLATDTYDRVGTPTGPAFAGPLPERAAIDRALEEFRGTILQQPPVFSAKKIEGRRSYEAARAVQTSAAAALPAPTSVTAYAIAIIGCERGAVTLEVTCSTGFYVRALAHDLGQALGTGAHLTALQRTSSGGFGLDEALPLEDIERDPARAVAAILPPAQMLQALSAVTLTAEGVRHAVHGRDVGPGDLVGSEQGPRFDRDGYVRLLDEAGVLVAIAEPSSTPGLLHPAVVLM